MLNDNEAIIISEVIGKIYCVDDCKEMRKTFLEMIETLIPYTKASFYVSSKDPKHILAEPVGIGISNKDLLTYIEKYEKLDYSRLIFMSGKSMVYRETDLFTDVLRHGKRYYREIYINENIYYSLQMCLGFGGKFLGIVSLYRDKKSENFSDKELFMLNLFMGHLEKCISKYTLQNNLDINNNKVYFDEKKFVDTYSLTSREVEVLKLMFDGSPNEKICDILVISNNTLKKHVMSIYKKLEIKNRWELINFI